MNLTALACPKCGAEMRTYERSGIHVDQCGECRGIFLDRGELERLVDAEAAHYARDQRGGPHPAPAPTGGPAPAARAADPWADPRRDPPRDDRRERGRDWDDDDDWDERRNGRDGRGRRGGFLGDVFDMFGD
jgi:Zn-finger nucleic acid-binding protein